MGNATNRTYGAAFIAMPGGIGTMGELMEVWTMNQLSEIDNAVGLLNIASFYQPCLAFIDHMLACKFSPPEHRHSICVDEDPVALIQQLRNCVGRCPEVALITGLVVPRTSASGRYCCKSRKSNDPKNLAKVDF
jgi:predicted Rossmann-fold nucleotide-binding protein